MSIKLRKVISVVLSSIMLFLFGSISFASDLNVAGIINENDNLNLVEDVKGYEEKEIVFDLEKSGVQEIRVNEEDGEEIIVGIEKRPSQIRAVGNGTYRVYRSKAGQWYAGYNVIVRNNIISYVSNGYHSGFTSGSLKKDSSKQATYYLKRRYGAFNFSVNLRARLLSNSIAISY